MCYSEGNGYVCLEWGAPLLSCALLGRALHRLQALFCPVYSRFPPVSLSSHLIDLLPLPSPFLDFPLLKIHTGEENRTYRLSTNYLIAIGLQSADPYAFSNSAHHRCLRRADPYSLFNLTHRRCLRRSDSLCRGICIIDGMCHCVLVKSRMRNPCCAFRLCEERASRFATSPKSQNLSLSYISTIVCLRSHRSCTEISIRGCFTLRWWSDQVSVFGARRGVDELAKPPQGYCPCSPLFTGPAFVERSV